MNLKGLKLADKVRRTCLLVSLNIIKNKINGVKGEGAQITIDYIAGMSIFLLTVAFVFQFMYGLFTPFQSGSEEVTLAADRASAILVERMLAADRAGAMSIIDQGKLIYFNNTKLNVSNQTSYTDTLRELGLFSKESFFDMNVSVANLTYPDKPMNQSGPELPDNLDIGQTRRFILIVNASTGYNETAIISVRVW